MAQGYKDFLSSPYFPRYGSLITFDSGMVGPQVWGLTTLFSLSGHLIVKGITFYISDTTLTSQPVLTLNVDGSGIPISLVTGGPVLGSTLVPIIDIRVIGRNPLDNSIKYFIKGDIMVEDNLTMYYEDESSGSQYSCQWGYMYYPVE